MTTNETSNGGAVDPAPPVHGKDPLAEGTWARSIAKALGILYLPALAPLFLGPLQECDHCVQTYYQYFPLVPGAAGFATSTSSEIRIALSMTFAVALFALVLWRLRSPSRILRWAVCVSAAIWVALQAISFSVLLRM